MSHLHVRNFDFTNRHISENKATVNRKLKQYFDYLSNQYTLSTYLDISIIQSHHRVKDIYSKYYKTEVGTFFGLEYAHPTFSFVLLLYSNFILCFLHYQHSAHSQY